MNNYVQRHFAAGSIVFLGLIVGWGTSLAEGASVAGIYVLEEVNGQQLPVESTSDRLDGSRCKGVILQGVLLLDSDGRSAAFVGGREACSKEGDPEAPQEERSTMFLGSYTVSGNQITIEDDFGTDEAVIKGDTLVYKAGGGDRPTEEWIFRKE